MFEIYLATSLLGLGIFFNKLKSKDIGKTAISNEISVIKQNPSRYESKFMDTVKKFEQEKVVTHNKNVFVSELLKTPLKEGDIVHKNMVPFFKGSGTNQNVDPFANSSILETYGAVGENKAKKEIAPLFEPVHNIKPIADVDKARDRMYVSKIQNNVLPFEQIKVGPGLGKEFGSAPGGGFNPLGNEELYKSYVLPKTVDDLRVASKPKVTYNNRIIDGKKISKRGEIGIVHKNENKNTYFEMGEERYMKTTGAVLKPKAIPKIDVRPTNRRNPVEYKGNPHLGKGNVIRSKGQKTRKHNLPEIPQGVATMIQSAADANKYDYGKGSIQVYANERDITTTKTYKGNVTTIVKSIIAPIQDIIKRSKKEYIVENPREFGNMSIQIPEKMTVKDPNDVARTTIKETTIHDSQSLNLKGPVKNTVYDPNSVARTTIKETTIHDDQVTNVVPRNKEGMFRSDIDPHAKKTIRETLDDVDMNANIKLPVSKQTIYDPDDVARKTVKQTTIDSDILGIVDSLQKHNAGYQQRNMEAKMTMKENNVEYYGNAQTGTGDAYQNASFEIKKTMKEDHEEYFGNAMDQTAEVPMDYSSVIDNATSNGLKSSTLVVNHEPTLSSVKVFNNDVNMDVKKIQENTTEHHQNRNRVVKDDYKTAMFQYSFENKETYTHGKQIYDQDDRLDPEILEPFRKNPYTQPLPK